MAGTRTAVRGAGRRAAGAGTAELGMMLGGLGALLLVAGAKKAPLPAAPVVHVLPFGRVLTAEELASDNLPSVDEIAGDVERRNAGGYDRSNYFYDEDEERPEVVEEEPQAAEAAPPQLGDGSGREVLEGIFDAEIVETEGEPAHVDS